MCVCVCEEDVHQCKEKSCVEDHVLGVPWWSCSNRFYCVLVFLPLTTIGQAFDHYLLSYFKCMHCIISVSYLVHQTLTWTTGCLTCVSDHSYACVCIHTGVGHTNSESAQHFWLSKTQVFLVLLTGFEPRVRRSTNWATPSPCSVLYISWQSLYKL